MNWDSRYHSQDGEMVGPERAAQAVPEAPPAHLPDGGLRNVAQVCGGSGRWCYQHAEHYGEDQGALGGLCGRGCGGRGGAESIAAEAGGDAAHVRCGDPEQAIKDIREGLGYRERLTSTDIPRSRKAMLAEGELTEDDLVADCFEFEDSHDLIFVGTPDSVSEQIERYRDELGLEHMVLFHNIPGLTHEMVMKSLSMFSEKVLPRFV